MRIVTRCLTVGARGAGGLLWGLLALGLVWTATGDPARAQPQPALTLTLSGAALGDVALEEPITLARLARALALLGQTPLPPATRLPLRAELDQAVWSTPASVPVDVFTDLAASPGQRLHVLTLPLTNLDTAPRFLPQAGPQDAFAWAREEDVSVLHAVGLDAAGRRFPVVAVLCGEAAVMPGAARACRLVWELPPDVALAAVELELPARLHHVVDRE